MGDELSSPFIFSGLYSKLIDWSGGSTDYVGGGREGGESLHFLLYLCDKTWFLVHNC